MTKAATTWKVLIDMMMLIVFSVMALLSMRAFSRESGEGDLPATASVTVSYVARSADEFQERVCWNNRPVFGVSGDRTAPQVEWSCEPGEIAPVGDSVFVPDGRGGRYWTSCLALGEPEVFRRQTSVLFLRPGEDGVLSVEFSGAIEIEVVVEELGGERQPTTATFRVDGRPHRLTVVVERDLKIAPPEPPDKLPTVR